MEQLTLDNYITEQIEKRNPQLLYIEDFIPYGSDNAISRKSLTEVTGLKDRVVRQAIEDARLRGKMILNFQDGKGYFISNDPNDLKRQYHQEHSRAMSLLVREKYIRQNLAAAGISV